MIRSCLPGRLRRPGHQMAPRIAQHMGRGVGRRGERGFVLVVVLWLTLLLAVQAAGFTSAAMDYLRSTRNTLEQSRAEMLADSGIRMGIIELMRVSGREPERMAEALRWSMACRLPEGDVLRIVIEDEAGKVDINTADDALLAALLAGAGADAATVPSLVAAIADWRDADSRKRSSGAELPEYAAAGRSDGPKNAAFDSVLELADVLGMTPELFARLLPHVTAHSGKAGIDPRRAAPELLALLSSASTGFASQADLPDDVAAPGQKLPPAFVAISSGEAFTVRAEGRGRNGARTVREAIVQIGQGQAVPSDVVRAAEQLGLTRLRQLTGGVASEAAAHHAMITVMQWGRAMTVRPSPVGVDAATIDPC